MPKIVDHEERRREVTLAAARIVIESGRSALTARNVAEATGWSTTVVSHYFDDMATSSTRPIHWRPNVHVGASTPCFPATRAMSSA